MKFLFLVLAVEAAASPLSVAAPPVPCPRQLFLDPAFVVESSRTAFTVNPPRSQEIVIRPDQPWESGPLKFTFYLTVLDEAGRLRMWYDSRDEKLSTHLAYAESTDGVHWTKRELGLVSYHGSKANNLTNLARQEGNVFVDPNAADPAQRYVYVSTVFKSGGIFRHTSPDGYSWKRDEKPFLPFEADSQNMTFWDTNRRKYVSYLRGWNISKPFGLGRKVVRLESERLDRPSGIVSRGKGRAFPKEPTRDPLIVDELPDTFGCDRQDPPATDIYTSAIQPYPVDPSWYVGFPGIFRHTVGSKLPSDGRIEVQFIGSRDGIAWQRYRREAYVGLGYPGSDSASMVFMGPGLVVRGDEIWQYGTGFRFSHGDEPSRKRQGDGIIYRYVQRIDGFVSLDFPAEGGAARCAPVIMSGDRLLLNVDTGAVGEIQAGLLDGSGKPLAGFEAENCRAISVNSTGAEVTWKNADPVRLRGQAVSVVLKGSRAKLYSFRFE